MSEPMADSGRENITGEPERDGRVSREDRRSYGVAKPERSEADDPAGGTPDQLGIEIDNALERPREGDPGERGVKKD